MLPTDRKFQRPIRRFLLICLTWVAFSPGAAQAQSGERDTLFHFEPENLENSLLEGLLFITGFGIYFEVDSAWTNYDLKEVNLLFTTLITSDTLLRIDLPTTGILYVKTSQPDTTPPYPYGSKGDLGLIPGTTIDTFYFNIKDTTELYPYWKIIDVSERKHLQALSGNFWLTGNIIGFTAFDAIPPCSYHNFTQGWGIWWLPNAFDMAVKIVLEKRTLDLDDRQEVPKSYNLYQNYPNPFNAQTTIIYNLGQDAFINLLIYDIKGEKVVTLFQGEQISGIHTITWDGKNALGEDAASGVYLYQLQYSDNNKTGSIIRKSVLLR